MIGAALKPEVREILALLSFGGGTSIVTNKLSDFRFPHRAEEYPTEPLSITSGQNLFGEDDNSQLLLGGPGDDISISWQPADVDTITGGAGVDTIDVVLAEYGESSSSPINEVVLAEGLPNSGSASLELPPITAGSSAGTGIFGEDLRPASLKVGNGLAKSIRKHGQTTPPPTTLPPENFGLVFSAGDFLPSPVLNSPRFVRQGRPTSATSAEQLCSKWSASEPDPDWIRELPDCPLNRGQLAVEEGLWLPDPFCSEASPHTQTDCCCSLFHPGAVHCVKRRWSAAAWQKFCRTS